MALLLCNVSTERQTQALRRATGSRTKQVFVGGLRIMPHRPRPVEPEFIEQHRASVLLQQRMGVLAIRTPDNQLVVCPEEGPIPNPPPRPLPGTSREVQEVEGRREHPYQGLSDENFAYPRGWQVRNPAEEAPPQLLPTSQENTPLSEFPEAVRAEAELPGLDLLTPLPVAEPAPTPVETSDLLEAEGEVPSYVASLPPEMLLSEEPEPAEEEKPAAPPQPAPARGKGRRRR